MLHLTHHEPRFQTGTFFLLDSPFCRLLSEPSASERSLSLLLSVLVWGEGVEKGKTRLCPDRDASPEWKLPSEINNDIRR